MEEFLRSHSKLMASSYHSLTGRTLLEGPEPLEKMLYEAPFVLLSHNGAPDPLFTYANLQAQRLWEMDWSQLVGMPSRLSAEAGHRQEREAFLQKVALRGFVDDYSGIRISSSGIRFCIKNVCLWNLLLPSGQVCGQAAMFYDWEYL